MRNPKSYHVTKVYRIGPKKVASLGNKQAAIYLPKELVHLKGKLVQVTIEVLEEELNEGEK